MPWHSILLNNDGSRFKPLGRSGYALLFCGIFIIILIYIILCCTFKSSRRRIYYPNGEYNLAIWRLDQSTPNCSLATTCLITCWIPYQVLIIPESKQLSGFSITRSFTLVYRLGRNPSVNIRRAIETASRNQQSKARRLLRFQKRSQVEAFGKEKRHRCMYPCCFASRWLGVCHGVQEIPRLL